ncbi:hypothetical protein GE061_003060 [Apolygus lucorum]|uniref:15-hydroxyprostaglandin dehydrogenase [NAD(+)] n=1 Tax=Apolygus lucorum TaxID=248454 RepID=A0A8S9X2U8_APOLU|nr:hypothetical protein GE061_003060 [Apolygus lucorum]
MGDLKDKSVMVIGGTTDVGAKVCDALGKEGVKLTICGSNKAQGEEFTSSLVKKYSPNLQAAFSFTNPGDRASVDTAFKKAKNTFEYVHYVINCAQIWDDGQNWTTEVDVNMRGTFIVSLLALEHLGTRKNMSAEGATVFNVSSTLAFQPNYLMPIFGATKAAVLKFTRDMGTEFQFGLNKIKFVAVCPALSRDEQSTFFNMAQTKMVLPYDELLNAWKKVQINNFQTNEHVASEIVSLMKSNPKNGGVYMIDGEKTMPPPPPATKPTSAAPKGPPPKGKAPPVNNPDRFNLNELRTDVTADIEKAIAATKVSELSKYAIFVTGGANGLGREIVKAFAKEGCKVAILDQDQTKGQDLAMELCKVHGKAAVMFFQCNLTDPKSFEASMKLAKSQLGRFDVLVNNASCWADNLEQFDKSISLNFKSVVTGSLLAVNTMGTKRGGEGGLVLNIADTLAFIPAFLTPIYAATKAAVIKFTSDMGVSQHYAMNKVGFLSIVPSGFSGSSLFGEPQNKIMVSGKDMMEPFTKSFDMKQAKQTAEQVAQNIVKIVKNGERSGTFLVENGNFKKIDLPVVSAKPVLM